MRTLFSKFALVAFLASAPTIALALNAKPASAACYICDTSKHCIEVGSELGDATCYERINYCNSYGFC